MERVREAPKPAPAAAAAPATAVPVPAPRKFEDEKEERRQAKEHERAIEDIAFEMMDTISMEPDGTPASEIVKNDDDQEAVDLLMSLGRVTGQTHNPNQVLHYRRLY